MNVKIFAILVAWSGLSGCSTLNGSVTLGMGTGAVLGATGGAVANYRNKGGNAAVGAFSVGATGAVLGYVLHKELARRDDFVRKETLFKLDTFGVGGIASFQEEGD